MFLGRVYQGEVDHMIRWFSDHTCISMSLVLNHYLVTPFPTMNKTLPELPFIVDNIQCTELSTKTENGGIDNFVNTKSSELLSHKMADDVTRVQPVVKCCHNGVNKVIGGCGSIAAQLLDILQEAVMKRVTLIPNDHKLCEHQQTVYYQSKKQELCSHPAYKQVATLSDARVAILFSGGVDSMVLAALVDRQGLMLAFHWLFTMLL